MPKFSQQSEEKLAMAHRDLITLFRAVIKVIDCTIIETYRDQAAQNKAFNEGNSKLKFPHGKHNHNPSLAIDAAPYPIDWEDTKRFYYFAGIVKGIAAQLKDQGKMTHPIRYGGDWDSDNDLRDQTFQDLIHFELLS